MNAKPAAGASAPAASNNPSQRVARELLYRFEEVDQDSANDDDLTIQVAFSSEYPFTRRAGKKEEEWGVCKRGERYVEILSHDPADADFSLLNRSGAFLDEHQDWAHLGKVVEARLSNDKRGRAVLKFDGESNLSKLRYRQMKKGSRPHISFGYEQTRYLGPTELPDGRIGHRFAYAADEISSVARPADPTVGARRSAGDQWCCIGCGEEFDRADLSEAYECSECRKNPNRGTRSAGDRKYGCLMAMLPALDSTLPHWAAENIAAENLTADGIEMEPHTTVLYGWSVDFDTAKLKEFLKDWGPVKIEVGALSRFECEEYDVIKFTVNSPDLVELNAALVREFGDAITFTKWVTGDGYNPHVTVAYVKKGTSKDLSDSTFEGRSYSVSQLLYSLPDNGPRTVIELGEESTSTPEPDKPTVDSAVSATASNGAHTNPTNQDKTMNFNRSNILLETAPGGTAGGGGAAVLDEVKVRKDATDAAEKEFKARAKEIETVTNEFCEKHGKKNGGKLGEKMRALATQALAEGISLEAFKTRCLTEVVASKPANPVLMADIANGEDTSSYSIMRGIQSCVRSKKQVPDGLEGEVHLALLERAKQDGGLGYEAEGFQVPADAKLRMGIGEGHKTRDMQATIFNAGGAFVPTQLLTPVIELLRNMMVLDKLGVRKMAGLQGNIVIPRQEASATAYSVSEAGLLTDSQQVLGQIALSPKRVGASQTYTKQFVMQSTPDAEAFMRDDLFKVIALAWDRLGLNGQGAGDEPMGIINTPGVGSILFGATPTYTKIVDFATRIEAANVTDPITYLTTPTVKGVLKITPATLTGSTVVSGATNALWTGKAMEGEMNGWPAFASNQVPGNLIIAGAFNQLIQALWGGLDVVVDQYTKAKNAEIVISINTWGDYAVRHPQAFVISGDAGNQ